MGWRVLNGLCWRKSWGFTLDFHTVCTRRQWPLRGYLWGSIVPSFWNYSRCRWRTHVLSVSNSLICNTCSFLDSVSFIPLHDTEIIVLDLYGKVLAWISQYIGLYVKKGIYTIVGVLVFIALAIACQLVPKWWIRFWKSVCSGTDQ